MSVPNEPTIGGISCFRVLDQLSDYLEGGLESDEMTRMNDHVSACGECRRFGLAFQDVIARLQDDRRGPEPLDVRIRQRLLARLQTALER